MRATVIRVIHLWGLWGTAGIWTQNLHFVVVMPLTDGATVHIFVLNYVGLYCQSLHQHKPHKKGSCEDHCFSTQKNAVYLIETRDVRPVAELSIWFPFFLSICNDIHQRNWDPRQSIISTWFLLEIWFYLDFTGLKIWDIISETSLFSEIRFSYEQYISWSNGLHLVYLDSQLLSDLACSQQFLPERIYC